MSINTLFVCPYCKQVCLYCYKPQPKQAVGILCNNVWLINDFKTSTDPDFYLIFFPKQDEVTNKQNKKNTFVIQGSILLLLQTKSNYIQMHEAIWTFGSQSFRGALEGSVTLQACCWRRCFCSVIGSLIKISKQLFLPSDSCSEFFHCCKFSKSL